MRLWFLRHAKSSWDDPALEDRDWPLAARGERAADRMRDYLDVEDIRPALVICSSALRARQTLARVLPGLGPELEVRIEPSLYTFGVAALLDRLRRVPERVTSVMLVGHNPWGSGARRNACRSRDRLDHPAQKYPTAELAEIGFPSGSWHELGEKTGELTRFVVPRQLG